MSARLSANAVAVRIGAGTLVEGLDAVLQPGEIVALLGRNGSGKTLTLRTLAGLRSPDAGRVELDGRDLGTLSRRDIARHIGLLPQDPESGFVTTVEQAVLIGRHPHLPVFAWEGDSDRRLAQRALTSVGLDGFGPRSTERLSGGEQRRVAIATLLVQQPEVYLLDEPTNHLDPHHQLEVLELFRARASEGATVLVTLHDPNLAARFADRVLLLLGNGRWQLGPASELLTPVLLTELYLTPMFAGTVAGRRVFVPG